MFPTEPVPERIGAYKVIRRLAGAGSADMYLGKMEGPMGFQRTCALKLVASSLDNDARMAEELAREASIVARLNHPAIVRMFDFFEYESRLVLVLEHVDGVDLDRLMQHLARRRQPLRDDAIWYVGHQLCAALAHAHAATDDEGNATPVVHRNLHPENVLIAWEGQVRLTGFGLGKVLGRTPDTVAGIIKGSPGYMAPEQARGERVTTRADVYGLGVLLWSMLTAKRPPIDGRRPESVGQLRSDIPREIAAAIDAALEPSPDRRKITCQELEQWLVKVTKVEAGRNELRDKVLRLKAARNPMLETAPEGARSSRGSTAPRRKISLRGIRPSQRPPGPGPLTAPPKPSSRPPLAMTGAPRSGPQPLEMPTAALRQRAPSSIPDIEAIDSLLDGTSGASGPDSSKARQSPPPPPPRERTKVGGMGAPGADAAASAGTRSPSAQAAPGAGFGKPTFAGAAADIELAGAGSLQAAPAASRDVSADGPATGAVGTPTGMAGADAGEAVKPLSTAASFGIAATTAVAVIALGVFGAGRDAGGSPSGDVRGGPTAVMPTHGPMQPARLGTPGPAEAPPRGDSSAGNIDPSYLPGGVGLITVLFTGHADVYLNGKSVGASNETLRVRCGRWFVRLGNPTENRIPEWVAKGETVIVPCQGAVTITMQPNMNP